MNEPQGSVPPVQGCCKDQSCCSQRGSDHGGWAALAASYEARITRMERRVSNTRLWLAILAVVLLVLVVFAMGVSAGKDEVRREQHAGMRQGPPPGMQQGPPQGMQQGPPPGMRQGMQPGRLPAMGPDARGRGMDRADRPDRPNRPDRRDRDDRDDRGDRDDGDDRRGPGPDDMRR
ncbi:MAG: hypothetical protein U0636_04290 [Phycisphaerales bacterium]